MGSRWNLLRPKFARPTSPNLQCAKEPEPKATPGRFYDDDQKVRPFKGTHPAVMRELAGKATWTYQSRNPLIRLKKNYFWEDVALLLKQCTGITLGVHKNYRVLK